MTVITGSTAVLVQCNSAKLHIDKKKKKILHNKTFKSGGVDVSLPNVADPEDYFLGSPYATAV